MVGCLTTLFLQNWLFVDVTPSRWNRKYHVPPKPRYYVNHTTWRHMSEYNHLRLQWPTENNNHFAAGISPTCIYGKELTDCTDIKILSPASLQSSSQHFKQYFYNRMFSSAVYLNHTYVVSTSIAIFINCFSCVTDLLFLSTRQTNVHPINKKYILLIVKVKQSRYRPGVAQMFRRS
jgi:hypothetical protein